MSLKASFVSHLAQKYPALPSEMLAPLTADNLLSSFRIPLSRAQVEDIKNEISSYWQLREWGTQALAPQYETLGLIKPANYSVCMSYDFHLNSKGKPELIEINTNASFLALGLEMYALLGLKNPVSDFSEAALIEMFLNEMRLQNSPSKSVAIVDEDPKSQKLFLEFLIFREILKKNSVPAEYFDISQADQYGSFGLIYNRYTDFYLQSEKSNALRKLFNRGVALSPHPYEYFLLADKQRLLDWNAQNEVARPASLLPVYDLGTSDRDMIWGLRKQLFFKPKNSFGGKQTYKGASISRKVFDEVFNQGFIAQQISPAPEIDVTVDGQPQRFKYDLRCYAYKQDLQMIVARVYQGQTTNLHTAHGGFACVEVS